MFVLLEVGPGSDQDGDVAKSQGTTAAAMGDGNLAPSHQLFYLGGQGAGLGFCRGLAFTGNTSCQFSTAPLLNTMSSELGVLDFTAFTLIHEPGEEAIDHVDEGLPGPVVAGYLLLP